MRPGPLAIAALLLAAGAGSAQDSPPDEDGAPPAEGEEASLRRETGRLIMRLLVHATEPRAELARLTITVDPDALVPRACRLELSTRRDEAGERLRLRFLAPPELRGRAWLLVWPDEGAPSAWAWDADARRARRIGPLDPGWRVGGSGLRLRDLRREDLAAHDYTFEGEARLDPAGPESRRVYVVRAQPLDGARPGRRLLVDARRHVPWRVEVEEDGGRRAVASVRWAEVAGRARPFAVRITEPDGRVSEVEVERAEGAPPAAHFDPGAFWRSP